MASGDYDKTSQIQHELEELSHYELQVGIFGEDGSFMQIIAAANEFGADITPKKGKWLTIPSENAPKGAKAGEIEGLFKPNGKNILAVSDGAGGLTVMFYLVKSIHIPERSFIRSTFDEHIDEWLDSAIDDVTNLAIGELGDAKQVLNRLGARIQRDIQAKITSTMTPANAPATIARKKSSSPLEDTGHLKQSITFQVVRM